MALHAQNLPKRPKHLPQVQALAAIGQCKLMAMWDELFSHLRQPVAQILLTRNDIADRTQYLNAQNTFYELLGMGVVPVVNENDTLSVQEIKFGDNDTLSAIAAGMVQADYLFLMTDVDCLYDKNPRSNPDAKPIEVVRDVAELVADTSSAGSALGTGGMGTKIVAARLATAAGVTTVITRSSRPSSIGEIVRHAEAQKAKGEESGQDVSADNAANSSPTMQNAVTANDDSDSTPIPLHTRFLPDPHPIRDRYFWLLHGLHPHGTLYIDSGAHSALANKANLLPAGILEATGSFGQHEAVRICVLPNHRRGDSIEGNSKALEEEAEEVGRCLVNYSAVEIKRIKGVRSEEIGAVLGYADSEYVALRENIAFFSRGGSRPVTPSLSRDGDAGAEGKGSNMGRLRSYVEG